MSLEYKFPGGSVVALCGGVGGAKLALGLSHVVPPDRLTIIVNTGDDFRHFGLWVSPDIDTVVYTLAGRANPDTGWGRAGESWRFMEAVAELGGETWFALGDTDLATSAVRTAKLATGERLTRISLAIAARLGVRSAILPMTDQPVATVVETDEGMMPFQHYFVGRRCEPKMRGLRFEGVEYARVTPEVEVTLAAHDLAAIVICPSNPFLSIDPILAVPGLRNKLVASPAPVVAVSPIIGGESLKGPLSKMMRELGLAVSAESVFAHYDNLVDRFVVDEIDSHLAANSPRMRVAPTLMRNLEDRIALARAVVCIAEEARE